MLSVQQKPARKKISVLQLIGWHCTLQFDTVMWYCLRSGDIIIILLICVTLTHIIGLNVIIIDLIVNCQVN
jgi:hypothetical protein